jgi:hypothetical protein
VAAGEKVETATWLEASIQWYRHATTFDNSSMPAAPATDRRHKRERERAEEKKLDAEATAEARNVRSRAANGQPMNLNGDVADDNDSVGSLPERMAQVAHIVPPQQPPHQPRQAAPAAAAAQHHD